MLGFGVAAACGRDEPVKAQSTAPEAKLGPDAGVESPSGDEPRRDGGPSPDAGMPADAGKEPKEEPDADAAIVPEPEPEPPTTAAVKFEKLSLDAKLATDFAPVPGTSDELLVLSQSGQVTHVALEADATKTLSSVELPDVYFDEGCGLLSLTFDPGFEQNRYVYIARCSDAQTSVLARYRFAAGGGWETTGRAILTVTSDQVPAEDWHRWGSMGFEPDGETLWVLLGDLFIRKLAQDVRHPAGSLLRLRPSRDEAEETYTPAPDNAATKLAEMADADPLIYAHGLRSPFRGARDQRGRFWVGDVGHYGAEEVNLITAAGQNLGWATHEGPCTESCEGLVDPLLSYGRSSDEPYVREDPETAPATKRAVWVGAVYEDPAVDRYYGLLNDTVIYGDHYTGWVRGVRVDEDGKLIDDRSLGNLTSVTSVRQLSDGYLYFLTLRKGLYRAVQIVD